ncbi:MAG TPA: hypothetical protein VF327_02515 [Gaiellaceae bacterium]
MRSNDRNHVFARRYAAALAVAALVVAAAAGCGGSSGVGGSKQSAAYFIGQVTTQFSRGQSGRLWDTLHPADQAVVSRARYVQCQTNEGFDLQKLKVLETYPETIDVAGKATPSTAVSLKTTASDGTTTATMHAVLLNGKWRWILSASDYAAYKQGKCPTG